MALTNTTGVFSGLDTGQLVQQLIAIERQPIAALTAKKGSYQAKISTYGSIKSALSSLRSTLTNLDSDKILSYTASSSDTSILTASALSTASAGTYSLVVSKLATTQKLYSTTFATSNAEVADLSVNTTQKLRIGVGSAAPVDITINSTNNTLTKIKDAINAAGAGVTATISDGGFTVDGTNNTIAFSNGASLTATLTAGTYTGAALAAEIKRALEAANGTGDTYAVTYDTTNGKFSIANSTGNTNAIILEWGSLSTTAESLLGFSATNQSVVVGATTTGDSAVGGYRLFLTSNSTGTVGRIAIKVDEDNDGTFEESTGETDTTALSRLAFNPAYSGAGAVSGGTANLTQSTAAVDASFTLDGFTYNRSSNTVTDLLTGVTLNLLKEASSTTVTLTVAKDKGSVTSNVNAFIGAYNKAMGLVRSMSLQKDGQSVLLGADGTARSIMASLRGALTTTYAGKTLASLGVSSDLSGNLSLNSSTLDSAMASDLSGVINSIDAMAAALDTSLKDYVLTGIPARTDGLNRSIRDIDSKIEQINKRVVIQEQTLRRKFLMMEQLMGQFQSSGNFLTQAFNKIGTGSGGGNNS